MQIGMVGLGKMGANLTRRLLAGGHEVVVNNRSPEPREALASEGALAAGSRPDLVRRLRTPRAVWLMLPAGAPTVQAVHEFAQILEPGDVLVDGGNSNYKDSICRARELGELGISFVDVGTSGGVWGLTEGYSLMVGGDREAVERLRPLFETLAPLPNKGWGRVGPAGAGHYVKMVHNGIEYGLMQAYAEGFEILKAKEEFALDLHSIAEIWRYGSVVRSWLLDLSAEVLAEDQDLEGIRAYVQDSGEGRWTVAEAIDHDVAAPVITLALLMRFVSRQDDAFSAKLLAALRNRFGGHALPEAGRRTSA